MQAPWSLLRYSLSCIHINWVVRIIVRRECSFALFTLDLWNSNALIDVRLFEASHSWGVSLSIFVEVPVGAFVKGIHLVAFRIDISLGVASIIHKVGGSCRDRSSQLSQGYKPAWEVKVEIK